MTEREEKIKAIVKDLETRVEKENKVREFKSTLSIIIGLPAWGWLLFMDWKIGIAIFLLLWASNLGHSH